MKMTKSLLKEANNQYLTAQINRVLPIDNYGIKIKLVSTNGATNYLHLGNDLLTLLKR